MHVVEVVVRTNSHEGKRGAARFVDLPISISISPLSSHATLLAEELSLNRSA